MPICLPQPSDSENGIPDDRKFGDVEIAGIYICTVKAA